MTKSFHDVDLTFLATRWPRRIWKRLLRKGWTKRIWRSLKRTRREFSPSLN